MYKLCSGACFANVTTLATHKSRYSASKAINCITSVISDFCRNVFAFFRDLLLPPWYLNFPWTKSLEILLTIQQIPNWHFKTKCCLLFKMSRLPYFCGNFYWPIFKISTKFLRYPRPVEIAMNLDILNNKQVLVLNGRLYGSNDVKNISTLFLHGKPRFVVY